jgi:hypothetical protein
MPTWLSHFARAYAEIGHLEDAWRSVEEAMTAVQTAREKWFDTEVRRTAGEIALMPPKPDAKKAEAYFEALAIAREQQPKSWELRAAMSTACRWRYQGKRADAVLDALHADASRATGRGQGLV